MEESPLMSTGAQTRLEQLDVGLRVDMLVGEGHRCPEMSLNRRTMFTKVQGRVGGCIAAPGHTVVTLLVPGTVVASEFFPVIFLVRVFGCIREGGRVRVRVPSMP